MSLAPGLVALQAARASAALPAAGAWDAAPTELFVSGADTVTVQFSYTRGGAGGSFGFQFQTSIYSVAANVPAGAAAWADGMAYAVGVIVAGADTASAMQAEYVVCQATGAAQEVFQFTLQGLGGTVERLRIPCCEVGNVGAPGTLQVEILAF